MKKMGFILPVIAAGGLLILAGCSDRTPEYEARRASTDRLAEAGRGRAAAEAATDAPAAGRFHEDTDELPLTSVSLTQIEGTLSYDDPEWYLDTGEEVVLLHLGNRAYLESLDVELEEGGDAVVFGTMEDDGLSVVRMITGGDELAFRSDSGIPLWAGNGNRAGGGRGQSAGRGAGQAAGRGTANETGERLYKNRNLEQTAL